MDAFAQRLAQRVSAPLRPVAVVVSVVVAMGCGEPRPGRALRSPTATAAAQPKVALPRAFRSGLTRQQVLERLPPLVRGTFSASFVAYDPGRIALAYGAISKWLAAHPLGRVIVRNLDRMGRRMGLAFPRSRADLKRWGIDAAQPAFVITPHHGAHAVWGVGLDDDAAFRGALLRFWTRSGSPPSWQQGRGTTGQGAWLLREGSRLRMICRLHRGRAVCAREASAFRLLRSGQEANLWQSLEPAEKRAVATDHGLFSIGARRAQLLVSWQQDPRGLTARGRMGGRNIERPLRKLALPSGLPKLAGLAPRAKLRGWTRFPLPLLMGAATAKGLGFPPMRAVAALDGEVAVAEGDAGPVVVLGVGDGKQADALLADVVKQLRSDGPLANWLALRAQKMRRVKIGALLGYELDLRSTERQLPFHLDVTAVRAPLGLIVGAGPAVQRMAARRAVANSKLAKRLVSLKAPLGDFLGPFLARIAPLLASLKMPLPAADQRFAAMLAAAFSRGEAELDVAGGWLRGKGRLDLAGVGPPVKTSRLVPAVLSSLVLLVSRQMRTSAGRNDLYGLRWALTRRARDKGAFPPGQSDWVPKLPCCKQPGGRCGRWIPGLRTGPWKDVGFAPSSAYHQWRYQADRRGTRVTIEARADQDCDGRYGVWRLKGRIDADGKPRFEPHQSEHTAE